MKRGLKVLRYSMSHYGIIWVTAIDPMKRGLKDVKKRLSCHRFCKVTAIDPMKRGLKALQFDGCIILNNGYSD